MLIIRLVRTGKKNAPSFRLVLVKKTAPPKSGRFLEVLGSYNPRRLVKKGAASGKKEINLKTERIKHWLSQGVKTSGTVHNLLVGQGLIKGPKIKKKIKVKKGKETEEAKEAQESAESRLVGETVEEKESVVEEKEGEKKEKIVKKKKKIKEKVEEAKEDKKSERTVKPEQKPEQKEVGLDKSAEKSKIEKE